jgi:endo-1,4-beta-xylanase
MLSPEQESAMHVSDRRFASLDPAIRACRVADASLTVWASDGSPLAGQEITLAQRDHGFLFGCNGFDIVPLANAELTGAARERAERLSDAWLALFNFATLPFYWGPFEPERGHPDTARLMAAGRWFADRGVRVKGHPLVWHTTTAPWLLQLSNEEIVDAQRARIQREVGGFAGVVDTWDVVNEAVRAPIYDHGDNGITRITHQFGRIAVIRMAFETARQSNPHATLLLNDYDMSAAFECLIEGCLECGIRIDALGLQSHMHQGYWGEEKTAAILDRFARYGLPIHFTENTILSGELMPAEVEDMNDYHPDHWPTTPEGEARQLDEVLLHYRTLLGHSAVKAITWWDLADGSWLGAPAGLVRADVSPKPAYEALLALVKGEWWLPPTPMRTDESGQVHFSGFLGEYEVTCRGRSASVQLNQPGPLEVGVAV